MTAPPPFTIGRTGRSDTEGGIDQGPWAIQDGPVHDQAHAVWAMAGVRDQGPGGRMGHVCVLASWRPLCERCFSAV